MPLVTLVIGDKSYGLPESFLLKYPRFPPKSSYPPTVILHDVHEDAGHTLVHFLYSGEYETINSPLNEDTSDIAREYKRSIYIYQASRKYGLAALEALAQKYIQHFGDEMSLHDILQETRDVFLDLPEDETWFPCYIKTKLQQMIEPSKIADGMNELYSSLGQDHHFDSIVLKMVVEILFVRLSFRERMPEDGAVPTMEAPPIEESAYEDCPPAEGPPEDAAPVTDTWEVDDPLVEDSAPAELVPEEPIPEEPVPEDGPHVAEPSYEEEAPQVDNHATDEVLSPAEALLTEGSIETVQTHLVRVSTKDLALYKGWRKLTSEGKARTADKLAARGLPTPSEDGLVSIFVARAEV